MTHRFVYLEFWTNKISKGFAAVVRKTLQNLSGHKKILVCVSRWKVFYCVGVNFLLAHTFIMKTNWTNHYGNSTCDESTLNESPVGFRIFKTRKVNTSLVKKQLIHMQEWRVRPATNKMLAALYGVSRNIMKKHIDLLGEQTKIQHCIEEDFWKLSLKAPLDVKSYHPISSHITG